MRYALCACRLGRHNLAHGFSRNLVTPAGAFSLLLFIDIDDQHAIDELVEAGFNEEGNDD